MADTTVYGKFAVNQMIGADKVDFDSGTFKVCLVGDSHTPNKDTHEFYNSITGEVSAGSGYTTGGATLTNVTVTYDTGADTVVVDADDVSWTFTAAKTFRYAVVYEDTGLASTSRLVWFIDFGVGGRTELGTFTIEWDAAGALHLLAQTS